MSGQITTLLHHFLQVRWRFRRLDASSLAKFQDIRARRIVAYARRHAPFYREHFQGHATRDWRTLPTVDKAAMMAHLGDFNTHGISGERAMEVALQGEETGDFRPTVEGVTVGLSSGTSGHRGLFLVSPWEQAAWAGALLGRVLPRALPPECGGWRVALFHRADSNLYQRLKSRWIRFRYFPLMTPLGEAVGALNQWQPHILVGPPTLLARLAGERQSGRLHARPGQIISVAEVLEPQERQRIEKAFDRVVGQIYQCTEGLLAVSCPSHGSLHIQEDLIALQTEPLPGGDESRRVTPVVTDLWRRAQPIIRYRLGDVLTLDERPCGCGSLFRVIAHIEGRRDDVCYFEANGGGVRPFYPDTIRRMILLASPAIADYQAVQERTGHLRVHVCVLGGARFDDVSRAVRASIERAVAGYDCRLGGLLVEPGGIPEGPGKRRRVRCLLSFPDAGEPR